MSSSLTPIGNLQTWYDNQRYSVYLQIAVTEYFNDTITPKDKDTQKAIQTIRNEYMNYIFFPETPIELITPPISR